MHPGDTASVLSSAPVDCIACPLGGVRQLPPAGWCGTHTALAAPCPLLQGSAEAVRDALAHMCTEQVRLQVRSAAVVGCCVDERLPGWAADLGSTRSQLAAHK